VTNVIREAKDVKLQDQTTDIIDLQLFRFDGSFTLANAVAVDQTQFDVVAGHGITAGDILCFQEGDKFMQAEALNVAVNTITIDTPFDYPYTIAGGCSYGTNNMAVNGSVTPQIFKISPGNLRSGVAWDITRMLFTIQDDNAMDSTKFGGIAALTNGITLRHMNSHYKNIFNAKTNGDFALHAYDIDYDDRASPLTDYYFRCRRSFNGFDKNGVVIRLHAETNDTLEIVIRDDLTGLIDFRAIAQGHVVE
jgi:hypothetical protein